MLAQGQYDEFASEIHLLTAPLRGALPRMDLTTYNVGGHGRPGIFIFGSRTAAARYPFPVSILIRWRDPAIVDYLESDAGAREGLRRDFEAKVKEILNDLETRFLIDWQGSSQDAEHGLVVELEGF